MRNSFKDPELQAEFARNGFVVVRHFSPEDAARLRAEAMRLLPRRPRINDPQGALYSSVFDERLRVEGGEFACGAMRQLLVDMLDRYHRVESHILAKVPGSPVLPMHQHQPVSADIFEPAIHAWTTLDDVDDESGALRVVPGSHAILRHVQSFNVTPYFSKFARALETRHALTIPLRAGETILFERSLLHGSAANRTDRLKLRLLATLLPTESALCILSEHGEEFEALEVGNDPLHVDSGLFCIAGGNTAGLKPAGRIDNRNMQITEREFTALIHSGKKLRPGYDPIDEFRANARSHPLLAGWNKLREFALSPD